jgi:hypothetical protein
MAEWVWLGGAVEVRQRHGCRSKRDHDLDEKGATVSDILPVFGGYIKVKVLGTKKKRMKSIYRGESGWSLDEILCSLDNLSWEKE